MAKLFEDLLGKYGIDINPMQELARALTSGQRLSGKARDFFNFVMAGRSTAETRWRAVGPLLLAGKVGSPVIWDGYEWITFHLPGGNYTPDFMYIFENHDIAFVEVKGSRKQRGYTTTRQKIRATASLNPWFYFFEAVNVRPNWEIELIEPEVRFLKNIIRLGNGE